MLNNIIHTERQSVTAIVAKMRTKEYFVDDSFQRRLVWTEKQKIRLIETILINYPMPEIYLWQQPSDPTTGSQTFSVVDGQQRLTTITAYVFNEFALKATALDAEHRDTDYAGKFWKDLSDARKTSIWDYVINVRHIPSTVSDDEVRRVFRRLNETDRSLNPQELRNAEFNGEFITNAERIANLPIWEKWEFFKPNQIRRMTDIEYCSGLLIFLRSGVVDDTPSSINEMFNLFNDKYEYRDADFTDVEQTLNRVDKITAASEKLAKLFLGNVHLYALFAVLHGDAGKMSDNNLVEKLTSFAEEYAKAESANKLIQDYREGASSRTRSKASRDKRVNSLVAWLLG